MITKTVFFAVLCAVAALFAACLEPVDPQEFINEALEKEIIIEDDIDLAAAIKNQDDGQKWLIKNGIYNVQLTINRAITVRGEDRLGVIISGPENYLLLKGFSSDDVFSNALTETETEDEEISALAENEKTSMIYGLITIVGCKATVQNLTVRGDPSRCIIDENENYLDVLLNIGDQRGLFCGIGIVDAEVTIEDVFITDIKGDTSEQNGGNKENLIIPNGYGIVAAGRGNDRSLTVRNSKIQAFQKNGVCVLPGVKKITFTKNDVLGGSGPVYQWPCVQNGMILECPEATITDSHFTNIKWTENTDAVSCGVMVLLDKTDTDNKTVYYTSDFLTETLSKNDFEIGNAYSFEEDEEDAVDEEEEEDLGINLNVYYHWQNKKFPEKIQP